MMRPIPMPAGLAITFGVLLVDAPADPAESVRIVEIVPEYMEGDLETAIIPTPQDARLGERAFRAGHVAVRVPVGGAAPEALLPELRRLLDPEAQVIEGTSPAPGRVSPTTIVIAGDRRRNPAATPAIDEAGLADEERAIAGQGEDAYLLHAAAGTDGRPNVVLLAGNSPAGDLWALATLRQMAFEKGGAIYIREGTIIDFPRFPYRGNKRPREWEWRYKANYGWFFAIPGRNPREEFRRTHARQHGAWVHHGEPLAATGAEMDASMADAAEYHRAGCREFVLKFDDTGSRMSPASEGRFGVGNYFGALHHYILGMHRRIKALDPANRVFFMPRPYYANSFELGEYARSLLAHGPLPADIGLSVCGPEVISPRIRTRCLREFRELFGLEGRAQIYDNYGRGGEYFACDGRDTDLWTEASALCPERGTAVTRITVYDYLWNPEAYDPDRSLRLAVRELSSGRPELYARLLDFVLHYNGDPRPSPATLRALKAKYEAIETKQAKSPVAVEVNLADELWGSRSPEGSYEVGEYARLRRRLDFEPYMTAYGWREGAVVPVRIPPAIDGRLDEPAWERAPNFASFVRPAWGLKSPPEDLASMALDEEESTRVKMLHSQSHLFIGITFRYRQKPETPRWARELWKDLSPPAQGDYAWRTPCFELFFDASGRDPEYAQIIASTAGIWLAKRFGVCEAGRVGRRWEPDFRFAFTLGEHEGIFEASIALADLASGPPAPGDTWGFQSFRSNMGTLGAWSGVYDHVGGAHRPDQFGRIVFQEMAPIAYLTNEAAPGEEPRFRDRIGSFRIRVAERAIILTGTFPEANAWRFDLSTFDGAFDMRRLYVPCGSVAYPDSDSIQTRRIARILGDPEKALTHTGPWEIFDGEWKVPTARVALDGAHVYTSWFDLPSLADQEAGRVCASFALRIGTPGEHAVRIAFDDFQRHTRWRPGGRTPERPEATFTPNPLRPHQVLSIAIGVDERTRSLEDVRLLPELAGRHPRMPANLPPKATDRRLGIADKEVQDLIVFLDPDRGELWEYSDDAESMASDNDMDAGRKGLRACEIYDALLPRLDGDARRELDRVFLERFQGLADYFVFQRNYNATGYAQNHCAMAVWSLLGAGIVWDGPEAADWLRWAVLVCRKRVDLLGRDGGLEWMNEARHYGLGFWERSRHLIRHATGIDLAQGPFFENEWRYALHNAPSFPANRIPVLTTLQGIDERANLPLPAAVTPQTTPACWHFDDCDQVFMRSDWGADALRLRLTAGSVFGKAGTPNALRYNWAHCPVNRGSIAIWRGSHPIINEPDWDRTYRKSAGNNNTLLVNDTDQWGGGQVWHPRLSLDQAGRIVHFADGAMLAVARADLADAYPAGARIRALSRVLVHLKPDHFLVFDRLETEGRGKCEWRFHTAFPEPLGPANRFAAYAFARREGKPATFDEAFSKIPDIRCEIAFLAPAVSVETRMSDPYFRWHAFRQPMRHLRVTQESDGPMRLLTAFAPQILLQKLGEGAFAARRGSVLSVVLIGPGSARGLTSDGHLAVAVHDEESGEVEAARFGGRRLTFRGREIQSAGGAGDDR